MKLQPNLNLPLHLLPRSKWPSPSSPCAVATTAQVANGPRQHLQAVLVIKKAASLVNAVALAVSPAAQALAGVTVDVMAHAVTAVAHLLAGTAQAALATAQALAQTVEVTTWKIVAHVCPTPRFTPSATR